jgi:hypothetical protein
MSDESGKTHVSIVICGHVDRRAVLHRSSRARALVAAAAFSCDRGDK